MNDAHDNTTCLLAHTQALLYTAGDLSLAEKDVFEAHLGACSDCARIVGDDARIGTSYLRLPQPCVSPSVISSLASSARSFRARRDVDEAARITDWSGALREMVRPSWAWGIAVAATLFIAINLAHRPTQSVSAPRALSNAVSESFPLPVAVSESLKQHLAEAETVRIHEQPKVEIAENVGEGVDEHLADIDEQIQLLALVVDDDQL